VCGVCVCGVCVGVCVVCVWCVCGVCCTVRKYLPEDGVTEPKHVGAILM